MKDEELQKQFEEYFEGANTPDNITEGAKKFVVKKSALPKIVKFASVAASFVLVFVAAMVIIFRNPVNMDGAEAPGADYDSADSDPGTDNDDFDSEVGDNTSGADGFITYDDGYLNFVYPDADTLCGLDETLLFLENLSAAGATVSECSAGYADGKLTLVKADVIFTEGHTQIYVEYTEGNFVYSALKQYYYGALDYYNGAEYYLTESAAENGGYQYKLCIVYDGVKYYFDIFSQDEQAYINLLETIVK